MTDLAAVQPGDPQARCGAANTVLGLTCNREPHPPGTAHYQDDGNAVRTWGFDLTGVVVGTAPTQPTN
ncbi:hypothetical protein [Micromonospora aurantiaca (nom. illeg.)]|uniref:hypothetical protein n=1 Tax=Micromonospora aurantiaca (nom. illeg.) TaxID=47850 RepID=UPI0033CD0F1A